jgi:hypothetical protein
VKKSKFKMGYIREPKGVVFTVINQGLSDEERSALTAFIKKSKKNKRTKMVSTIKPKKSNLKILATV